MRKYRLAVLSVALVAMVTATTACGNNTYVDAARGTPIPDQFQVDLNSGWSTTLDVVSQGLRYDIAKTRSSWSNTTLEFQDTAGVALYIGVPEFNSSGDKMNLHDADGKLTATIEDSIHFSSIDCTIKDGSGRVIASAIDVDDDFSLTDPSGRVVAKAGLKQSFSDTVWNFEVINGDQNLKIDLVMLAMLIMSGESA